MRVFDLDTTLLDFSDSHGSSAFTVREAVCGIQIFGGIGSGKTSSTGYILATKFLENGFGGLVLTTKAEEKKMWQDYCQKTGRLKDLVILEPGGKESFNFLEFVSSTTQGGSITANIVQVLKTVIAASQELSGDRNTDKFWESALDLLLYNVVDLCSLAYGGKVSVQKIYDIVLAAPKKDADKKKPEDLETGKKDYFKIAFRAAQKNVTEQVERWRKTPEGKLAVSKKDEALFEEAILEHIPDARLILSIDQFFIDTYRNLSEKTRSIIDFSFTNFLFLLLKEPYYSLFCKATTLTPNDCLDGKVILINLPVKHYHEVGRDSQIMFKYIYQRTMEMRDVEENGLPVFLWADESQNFIHPHDATFQATARSSRIATCYITQNLPNYQANMGGSRSEAKVNSFLGTLSTKFFHANADVHTNQYASELIGKGYKEKITKSVTIAEQTTISQSSVLELEHMVRPSEFTGLLTGSSINNKVVEAYIHRQGAKFHNDQNFKKARFRQQ